MIEPNHYEIGDPFKASELQIGSIFVVHGQIGGGGRLHDDGLLVSVTGTPAYLGRVAAHTCPQCGFRNEPHGWTTLLMYTCRSCGFGHGK